MRLTIRIDDDGTVLAVTPPAPRTTSLFGPLRRGAEVSFETGPVAQATALAIRVDGGDPTTVDAPFTIVALTAAEAQARGLLA